VVLLCVTNNIKESIDNTPKFRTVIDSENKYNIQISHIHINITNIYICVICVYAHKQFTIYIYIYIYICIKTFIINNNNNKQNQEIYNKKMGIQERDIMLEREKEKERGEINKLISPLCTYID
jgi:hypothetical protein